MNQDHQLTLPTPARRSIPTYTTELERQLDVVLLSAFEDVVDVKFLPSNQASGRPNPKVFVVVREVDIALYEQITRVTMQLVDLQRAFTLNFDIIPESAAVMLPVEARSVRR